LAKEVASVVVASFVAKDTCNRAAFQQKESTVVTKQRLG
jgi:hypothetical protein